MTTPSVEVDLLVPAQWRRRLPLGALVPPQVRALARYLDGQVATPRKVASVLQELMGPHADREVRLVTRRPCDGLVVLRIEDLAWPMLAWESLTKTEVRVCRVCGCTQDLGCRGGCYWIRPDLCSSCYLKGGS